MSWWGRRGILHHCAFCSSLPCPHKHLLQMHRRLAAPRAESEGIKFCLKSQACLCPTTSIVSEHISYLITALCSVFPHTVSFHLTPSRVSITVVFIDKEADYRASPWQSCVFHFLAVVSEFSLTGMNINNQCSLSGVHASQFCAVMSVCLAFSAPQLNAI